MSKLAHARDLAIAYPSLTPDAPAEDAARLLAEEAVEGVFVPDEHGALQGLVSDTSDRLSLRAVADEKEPLMSYAKQLLDTYPRDFNVDAGVLAATIDALSDCAQACTACADDCLSEQNVAELVKCIRLNLDCADVCAATLRVLSRQTEYDANLTRPQLQACVAACRSCGDECERHGQMHQHCRVCAEACRHCEQACQELLAAMK